MHFHITEEWRGCKPRNVADLSGRADARTCFDSQVRVLRDVIGMAPRDESRGHHGRTTQILDGEVPFGCWVAIRLWDCDTVACDPARTVHEMPDPNGYWVSGHLLNTRA